MYNKSKLIEVSNVKQIEDKYFRFEYDKASVDIGSGIRGLDNKIRDCR